MNRKLIAIGLVLLTGLVFGLVWLTLLVGLPALAAADPAGPRTDLQVCAAGCAYTSVQAAVDAAQPGDVIMVATGVYTGVLTRNGVKQVTYISKSLTLRGGYDAGFAVWDPQAYPTTLDAERQGRVMTIIGAVDVTVEGLRLTNGLSSGMGGLYLGQYTCGLLFGGSGGGGGVCVQNATATLNQTWILTNTAGTAGGRGGGLFAAGANLTVTNSTIQGNNAATGFNRSYGGGLFLAGGRAWVEGNTIANNSSNPNYDGDGGGVLAIGANATLRGNAIRGNHVRGDTSSPTRLGGGGVAISGGAVTLLYNQIVGNEAANYTGGGLAWNGGTVMVTGNLALSNTARWGGAIWAGNAPAWVDNNVVANNTASGHGSAIYVNTYNPNTPLLRHNTIVRNHGGDGVAIYVADYGRAAFRNTILAEHGIGVGVAWGTSVSFERTLWDGNITDTVGLINEVGHLDGSAALAADGYHLTESSDAVDAGIDAGLTTDVDGEARPQGNAPDIGADESPYGQAAEGDSINVEKTALHPRLVLTTRSLEGEPVYLIQQEYLIQIANGLTNTALAAYSVADRLPVELDYAGRAQYPPMSFHQDGNTLLWNSLAALPAENMAWMSLVGNAVPEDGGKVITNVASVTYTLSSGGAYNQAVQVASLIPNFPPFITFPENGEYCLDGEGDLEIWGIAKPGADVYLYEDGAYIMSVTASISGTFYASYRPAHWAPDSPVALSARDCSGGPCGNLSNIVTVRQPANGWCPQRSVWEGTLGENHYRWPFRGANGAMTTQDWEIPGAYGFWNTTLKLYECDVPDEGYAVTDVVVEADGIINQDADGEPDSSGAWAFSIGSAHTVNIIVTAENDIGATKTYTSHGHVLIDPDGFVFDVTEGFQVISSTAEGVPIEVMNTVAGVTVTCMVSVPQWGGWVPWPAQYYRNQVNPQVTGDNGYFAFFTPPGLYYLQVDGVDGHQPWRSPVIEVITEIVHVNVPLTPWSGAGQGGTLHGVRLMPGGPSPTVLTVPAGGSVEWLSVLSASATITDLVRFTDNPILRPLSARNPLSDTLGWDGGMLAPGQAYRRLFIVRGTYEYTDGAGHTGQVIVTQYRSYLPLVVKNP